MRELSLCTFLGNKVSTENFDKKVVRHKNYELGISLKTNICTWNHFLRRNLYLRLLHMNLSKIVQNIKCNIAYNYFIFKKPRHMCVDILRWQSSSSHHRSSMVVIHFLWASFHHWYLEKELLSVFMGKIQNIGILALVIWTLFIEEKLPNF